MRLLPLTLALALVAPSLVDIATPSLVAAQARSLEDLALDALEASISATLFAERRGVDDAEAREAAERARALETELATRRSRESLDHARVVALIDERLADLDRRLAEFRGSCGGGTVDLRGAERRRALYVEARDRWSRAR